MTARACSVAVLSESMLLQAFEPPITFHRCLIPVTGSVTAALLLSQAIRGSEELEPQTDGWFVRSQEQWTEETGLSRWELETARRVLRQAGLLEERRVGMPARLWFRVRADRVFEALQCHAERFEGRRE